MNCPTVQIKSPVSDDNPTGFVVINESDFDPAVHERFDAEPPKQRKKADKAD
jgi:hypothetical protein